MTPSYACSAPEKTARWTLLREWDRYDHLKLYHYLLLFLFLSSTAVVHPACAVLLEQTNLVAET
jgi:hypothetical protein